MAGLIPGTDDNVFIVYHDISGNSQCIVSPEKFSEYQGAGEIAEGVVIVSGGRTLVVATTGRDSTKWSSANLNAGGLSTGDSKIAMTDWKGKKNTEEQVKHSECSGKDYASGFCHAFVKTNKNGEGFKAGEWWLPSLAEMMLIFANKGKINRALAMIKGAEPLTDWCWTSTECGDSYAWALRLSNGYASRWSEKNNSTYHVRPVTSIALNDSPTADDIDYLYGEKKSDVKIPKADLASIVAGLMRVHHYDFSIAPKETKKIPMASMGLLIANNGMVSGHCIIASMSNLGIIPSFNPESSGFEFTENPIKHVGVYVKRGESDLYMKNAHETLSMPIKMVVIGVGKF